MFRITNNSGSFKGMKQLKLWKYLSDDLHVNFKIFPGEHAPGAH